MKKLCSRRVFLPSSLSLQFPNITDIRSICQYSLAILCLITILMFFFHFDG
ncbi:hypothetical protein HMPREF3293_02159 [Christensenella minuta]|uniref:Uncharacterized protein n=1 Tax=Christensenella minuta TaxID=626937 RepID=A0A136Q2M4_9FIRM|nr:hypothetical protein HMPREF3293_02159 [Christensenella minuta]